MNTCPPRPVVSLGIEELGKRPTNLLAGRRLALLCNQASTDSRLRHSRDLLAARFPGALTCLFTPQHGFFSEKQDNMIESGHWRDPLLDIPVYSLYAERRRPSEEMFADFDVLLVDLFDVGTRVYTFIYTMAYCLEAAARYGRKVIVLDRPNPVGGERIEGAVLRPGWESFVGLYPIPMRHGLTVGEMALLMNTRFGIGADLEIVAMQGWRRSMLYPDTGLPWVFPSPNMPTFATALVYPGQVIWEGTNVSEGRGTTLPFELAGAPEWDTRQMAAGLAGLPGCVFRPLVFEPTSGKWAGKACQGFHLHVTDPAAFRPLLASLCLLREAMGQEGFAWKQPPYEYEYDRLPIDIIFGGDHVRKDMETGRLPVDMEKDWRQGLAEFEEERRAVFLYT
ncbi:MAG: DUF1343 domain-containing protein [Thermodesulfobacteriota bacterium]